MREQIPVLTPKETTGNRNFAVAIGDAVRDILLFPIEWVTIFHNLDAWVKQENPKSFSIVPLATTAEQIIYAELRKTSPHISLPSPKPHLQEQGSRPVSFWNAKTPKLAIIGMSGRFPGANDIEEFWNLLHQGLGEAIVPS